MMSSKLTLEVLKQAIAGNAAAFRSITEYQPAGGPGDKVFPPTYEGGKYAVETRTVNGEKVQCVLLDSVQSQANRMELALLEARRRGKVEVPLISVRFDKESLQKRFVITSLEAPHRAADAIFRDSLLEEEGVTFRKSSKGRILDNSDIRNATGLFGLCPTALIFGIWDSAGPRGGLGAKFQRALVSEIVGWDATLGVTTGGKIDQLGIILDAGKLYRREVKSSSLPEWTLDPSLAEVEKGPVLIGKKGKPSEANLGGVTPDFTYVRDRNGNIVKEQDGSLRIKGGVTISKATQTTVLSLAALRRLCFPLNGNADSIPEIDYKARTVLAALGLYAASLAREEGADLRSRCQLIAAQATSWELLDKPGHPPQEFALDAQAAEIVFQSALLEAKVAGLPWEDTIHLIPSDELLNLVKRSQEAVMQSTIEEVE